MQKIKDRNPGGRQNFISALAARSYGQARASIQAQQRLLALLAILLAFAGASWAAATFIPMLGNEWYQSYREAALQLISGQSPYQGKIFYPPWFLCLFIPFALLPLKAGWGVFFATSLFAFAYLARRFGAKKWKLALYLLSYPVGFCLINGQIEWLAALGFLLPPQLGLFLVLSKPQIGIGVGLYWLAEAWKRGRWKEVLRVFSPVVAAFILSFIVFGPYFLQASVTFDSMDNASAWPVSIPLGLVMLAHAIRNRRIEPAIMASPFLAPYVGVHSWSIALLGLASLRVEFVLATASTWLVWVYWFSRYHHWI